MDLVFEFLPARCYLVAAWADLASVIVWEVLLPDRTGREGPRANTLQKWQLSFSRRLLEGYINSITFLPHSDTLVGDTFLHDPRTGRSIRCAVFWDARSGLELLRVEGTELVASSPRGDVVLGKSANSESFALTFWNATTGSALWTLRPGQGSRRAHDFIAASFSPEGDMVAVLVSEGRAADCGWSVEVWSSTEGERLCGMEMVRDDDVCRGSWDFAFDGSTVAICRGTRFDRPGVILRVVPSDSGCQLRPSGLPDACDATHLATGAQLHVAARWAKITGFEETGAHDGQRAALGWMPELRAEAPTRGIFAPDGRSVTVSQLRDSYVWAFVHGELVRHMCDRIRWRPVFSADSAFVALVCGSRDVLLFAPNGAELLRLSLQGEVKLGGVAVTGHRP